MAFFRYEHPKNRQTIISNKKITSSIYQNQRKGKKLNKEKNSLGLKKNSSAFFLIERTKWEKEKALKNNWLKSNFIKIESYASRLNCSSKIGVV